MSGPHCLGTSKKRSVCAVRYCFYKNANFCSLPQKSCVNHSLESLQCTLQCTRLRYMLAQARPSPKRLIMLEDTVSPNRKNNQSWQARKLDGKRTFLSFQSTCACAAVTGKHARLHVLALSCVHPHSRVNILISWGMPCQVNMLHMVGQVKHASHT